VDDERARIAQLAGDLLPALIARLDASDLGELEVRGEGWRVRLRKPFDRRRPPVLAESRRRRGRQPEAGAAPGPTPVMAQARTSAASSDSTAVSTSPASAQAGATTARMASSGAAASAVAGRGGDGGPGPDDKGRIVATSPAVGYFGSRDGFGAGRSVRAGDVVGYVDCLGVRYEVVAPVDGVLGRTIAQPGEAVEYGQPLVHIGLPATEPG